MQTLRTSQQDTKESTTDTVAKTEELYLAKAQEAKAHLIGSLSGQNLKGAYRFIADALAHALTNDCYEEIEARREMQENYLGLSHILDMCHDLKEAESWVELCMIAKEEREQKNMTC